MFPLRKYVHHRGKTWENTGRTDWLRRLVLVDWIDNDKGTVADPDMVRNCTMDEIKAIEEIKRDADLLERIRRAGEGNS